jgi:PiT family inorganic phosphate transporter
VVGNIFLSWIVTLPAGGLLAILFFFTLKGAFGS